MKLRTRILVGYLTVLLTMLVTGLTMYTRLRAMIETAAWATHTHEVITDTEHALRLALSMESGLRGFVVTGDESFLALFEDDRNGWEAVLGRLWDNVSYDRPRGERVQRVAALVEHWHERVATPEIELRRQAAEGGAGSEAALAAAFNMVKRRVGKNVMDSIRVSVAELTAIEEESRRVRQDVDIAAARLSVAMALGGTFLALLLGTILMLWTTRSVLRQVGGEPAEIEVITHQIAAGDYDLALPKDAERGTGILAAVGSMAEAIRKNEERLERANRELELRGELVEPFATEQDEDVYFSVLQTVLRAMDSPFGVFGYIDEQGGLTVPSMTRHIWAECQVPDKTIVFPRDTWGESTWPRAVIQKRQIHSNQPSTITPAGHIAVGRHISQPIVFRGESIGLLQVANAPADYSESDLERMQYVADAIAPILAVRLEKDRVERIRQAAEADLQRSNQELEQFAYVASHDLQEPLRIVSSYTQMLERRYSDQLDDDARDFIRYAVDGANRMQRLVQDLLTFSRVSSRGREMLPVDSQSALDQALANLQAAIEESHAIVTSDDLPIVEADDTQLVMLFQNLVGNAIKFHGESDPQVHVSAEREDSHWRLAVQDNGIGIDGQYLDRIFLVFQRLHSRDHYPGTGIGLAVCKRIVERHGGEIGVESLPGEGSSFHFTLRAADEGKVT